jgi:DNA-binding protein HU-alpha
VVGFGAFKASNRKARTGRNPKTGEEIMIKAIIVPKFMASKALRDSVEDTSD